MYSADEIITITNHHVSYSLDAESSSSPDTNSTDGHEEQAMEEFSVFLEKLTPLLDEIKDKKEKMNSEEAMHKAINSMLADYYRAKAVINTPNFRSSPANHIQDMTQNLGRSLGLVLFASYEVPFDNKDKLDALHKAMMNAKRVDPQSYDYAESEEFIISEEEEDEIVLDKRDLVYMLNCGNDEEFACAISDLMFLISDNNNTTDDRLDKESIVSILCDRLKEAKSNYRLPIIQLLRSLINISDKSKEKMADVGFLSVLVKSLARDNAVRREAVGLLSFISEIPDVWKRIGKIQGCIVMLVSILEGGDEVALIDAAKVLDTLSSNPQFALNMAEAGYFSPLIHYLKGGSDIHKMLMAAALSRIELTDKSKASLGEEGAIELLVNMFINGNFEAKLSALNSLKKISTLKENIQRLIDCGFMAPLFQLLFSVTSVLMSLREPASAILALIAQSESILVTKQDVAQQMFSLLSLTSPLIQCHLLNALNSVTNHDNSARKVRKKMREKGAIKLLLPFITNRNPKISISALELMYKLSKDKQDDLMKQLGETDVNIIGNIVISSASIHTKTAAIRLLSILPASDKKSTGILKQANLLPVLISLLSQTSENSTFTSAELAEGISGILIRFTIPSDKNLQRYSVEQGLFPALMKLLCNGSTLAKTRSASCLAQLSQNSLSLSDSRRSRWFCLAYSVESLCEVHDQNCSISTTFCLVKAKAVPYLIKILETDEIDVHEEALGCLATLLNGKTVKNGSNFIAKHSGIIPIINVLHSSSSVNTKEKAIWILERIFSVEIHRVKYGESGQMILLELAQHGDTKLRPSLAKVLAQLELLQVQSSYF